ncbi:MAG: hypothetical protein PHH59_06165 [Methylovulum sp.]|uniref:hypothetical protein n=1 Tax=Methylovulum sp. TaxID=1916980 RepID=UPI00260B2DF8|nr:hypothetical protein [Methylovulum sp.]MDD2723590.1 hypothetical protein [Methylovulum sp.]MDD5126134.1 hypothetical protein [Methylovulum sp.]
MSYLIKKTLKSGKYLGKHSDYGRLAASMRHSDLGFTLDDFIEVTPHVSKSKTAKDAKRAWDKWDRYSAVTKGTLMYLINNR